MKHRPRILLFLSLLVLISLACGASSIITPTPTVVSAADIGMTMIGDRLNAEATQQKFDSIVEITEQVVAATATQQAVFVQATQSQQARDDAQATAQKAEANAQATSAQERRDAQATQQRIDADSTQLAVNAQATQMRLDFEATQSQARLDLAATQQAEGTARAWTVTQSVLPTHDYWTQQAVQQDMLLATNEVELSNLKVMQQQDTNVIEWVVPLLIALFAAGVGANYLANWSKIREVKNGNGDVEFVIFRNQKAIAPRLMPKPLLELETGEMPDVTDPKEQAEIVKRDQGIRALEVMPDHPSDQAAGAFNDIFSFGGGQRPLPVIQWVPAEKVQPEGILEELEGQVLED